MGSRLAVFSTAARGRMSSLVRRCQMELTNDPTLGALAETGLIRFRR